MTMHTFTITDYSRAHTTTRKTFAEALEVAHGYFYGQGHLTVTIRDEHGCRWNYYGDGSGAIELMACPATANGYPCDCATDLAHTWMTESGNSSIRALIAFRHTPYGPLEPVGGWEMDEMVLEPNARNNGDPGAL